MTAYASSHKVNGISDDFMVEEAAKFIERCKKAKFLNIDPRVDSASSQATKLVFMERKVMREQVM